MQWEDKICVKKGNYGEVLCDAYLISKGVTPYLPSTEWGKPHPFDRLCAIGKKRINIVECKTKEARLYYPDTGVNIKHFDDYKYIADTYGLQIIIFFIDKDAGCIYGNDLNILEKKRDVCFETYDKIKKKGINYTPGYRIKKIIKYPFEQKGIRYWPLEAMVKIHDILRHEKDYLSKYTAKNKKYNIDSLIVNYLDVDRKI